MSAHISRIGQAPISITGIKERLTSLTAMVRAYRLAMHQRNQIDEMRETLSPEVLADIGLTPKLHKSSLSNLGQAYCVLHSAPLNLRH